MLKRSLTLLSLLAASMAQALTYSDDFANGLDATTWTYSILGTGTFSLDDTQGDVRLARTGGGSGQTNALVSLNLAALGGPIAGDFSTSIDLSDAVATGPGISQIEFQAAFSDGSYFLESYSNEGSGLHVWDGGFRGGLVTAATAGTLHIERVGTTLSAFFGNDLVYANPAASLADLNYLAFTVQNFSGTGDVSGTFDNFKLTTQPVPEPASLAALGLGALGLLRGRRANRV